MPDYDTRLDEMEQSIKLLAKYVSDTAQGGSSKEGHTSKSVMRKLERVEQTAEHALKAAEAAETSVEKTFEKMKPQKTDDFLKAVTSLQRRVDEAEKQAAKDEDGDISRRMAESEARLSKLSEDARAMRSAQSQVQDALGKAEAKIYDAVQAAQKDSERLAEERFMKLETLVHDTATVVKEDVDAKLHEELSHIEELLHGSGQMLTEAGMQSYMDRMNQIKSNLESYVNVKTQMVENDVREIKGKTENFDKIIAEKISSLQAQLAAKVKEVEFAVQEATAKLQQLSELDEVAHLRKDVSGIKAQLEENFVGDSSVHKKISDLESRLGYVHALRDELSASRREFDEKSKRMDALVEENFVGDSSVHKRIGGIEAHLKSLDAMRREINVVRAEMAETKGASGETKATIASFGKRLQDLEVRLRGFSQLEHIDFDKLMEEIRRSRKSVDDFEKDMKAQAMGFLAEQLNEFARTMDKRLPELVTKGAYLHDMTVMNNKLRTIEAPDMSYLNNRMSLLEDKVREISEMMRSIYNRLPVVVE